MAVTQTLRMGHGRVQGFGGRVTCLRRLGWRAGATLGVVFVGWSAAAAACVPPQRPYVPEDRDAVRSYASILKGDFEAYFTDVQGYFGCLDEERARVFEEAREVSQDYGMFLETVAE